jgi:hypothetical protein
MKAQKILQLIQDRIDGASRNEEKFNQQWHTAQTDEERAAYYTAQQISTAQRLVLQGILDEINGTNEETIRGERP